MSKRDYNPILDDAALAIAQDDGQGLQECLQSAELQSNNDANFWLLRAYVGSTLEQKGLALQQALQLDPENPIGLAGLSWIRGIQEIARGQLEAKQQAEKERAEALARQQAEEEARRKAEQERIRAEQEARRKAAEEARLRAERESQRQAAEEARRLAEQAARRQVELERRQAELEEKKRAEKESRLEVLLQADQAAQKKDGTARAESEPPSPSGGNNDQPSDRINPNDPQPQAYSDLPQSDNALVEDPSIDVIESQLHQQVTLLAGDVRQQLDQTQTADKPDELTDSQRPLILAVDESPTVRKLISLTLTPQGYEVVTAGDGVEALSLITRRLPDLILSDINMPKIGGFKLCNFVKKHDRTRHIPVIMLSGKDGLIDKMRGRMNGCDGFIAKPLESGSLIEIVRVQLANPSALPAVSSVQ